MISELIIPLVIIISAAAVEGYITCGVASRYGPRQCYGTGAYCCGLYNDECCWDSVLSFWWFWFIWLLVVFLIIACSICICIRRRRQYAARPRYVVVESNQATYGTMPPVYSYPPSRAGYQSTSGPTLPPTAPAYMYQEKPPDYNTVVAN